MKYEILQIFVIIISNVLNEYKKQVKHFPHYVRKSEWNHLGE